MRIAFLSPSIVETVVEGRTPVEPKTADANDHASRTAVGVEGAGETAPQFGSGVPADWRWWWKADDGAQRSAERRRRACIEASSLVADTHRSFRRWPVLDSALIHRTLDAIQVVK
jgi:hypothetical protein